MPFWTRQKVSMLFVDRFTNGILGEKSAGKGWDQIIISVARL